MSVQYSVLKVWEGVAQWEGPYLACPGALSLIPNWETEDLEIKALRV